ncbi:unnamed protein product [Alternaria sp. RS040]
MSQRSPEWDPQFQRWFHTEWDASNQRYYRTHYVDGKWEFFDWMPNHPRADLVISVSGHVQDPEHPGSGGVIQGSYNPSNAMQSPHYELLDPSFHVRDRTFFEVGKVFAILFTEPAGANAQAMQYNDSVTLVKYNEHAYTQIRRFVVVKQRREFCFAMSPVFTYGNRGTTKPGVAPDEHTIIYSLGSQPTLVFGEAPLRKASIPMVMAPGVAPLSAAARIYFGIHHPIQYNVKVKDLGDVHPEWVPTLLDYWNMENGEASDPTASIASTPSIQPGGSDFEEVRNPHMFFKPARVFMTPWTEPEGFSGQMFTETARFVVVKSGPTFSVCLRISTYSGQATSKPGVIASHHAAVIPQGGTVTYHPHEKELINPPIEIKVENDDVDIDPMARINFAKPYTVEHNIWYPADEDICMEAAALAVRLCMYLLTTGQYLRVLNVLAIFKTWSATILPACFEAMTALSGKEAVAHALNGNISTAFRSFRRLHRSRTKTLGTSDLCTLHSLNGLGLIHHAMGNVREAVQHHKSCFQSKSGLLGLEDPDTLVSANNLGIALLSQGNNDAAKQLFDKSLTSWSQAYGADDLFVITARSNQGIALHFQGKLDEAEHSHRYVYKKRHRILGPHHHETVKSQANLAITLNERGHHAEAEALYREALTIFQAKLGEMHPDTLKTHTNLATALHDQGKFRQAEIFVASAVPLMQKKLGATHVETLGALEFRAILLQHLGKFLKAHSLATELYEVREKKLGFYHDDTQRSLQHLRDLAEDVEEAHVMRRFPSAVPVAIC